jgi:two-component sensor histidine kinase
VQAIVSQTLRFTTEPKEAVQAINARLVALRDADEMLMSARWDGAPLTEIVGRGFAICGVDNPRIHVAGPNLDVGPKTTVALTMAIHELCTNAVKYGALSNDTGTVDLVWSVDQDVADPKLRLRWEERGGPPVTAPERMGFGSKIIQQYCKSMLRAEFALSFEAEGLEWTLDAPLESAKQ